MITPELIRRLNKLHANCVFRSFGPTYKEYCRPEIKDKEGNVLQPQEPTGRIIQVNEGHVECDIVDRTQFPGRDGQLRYTPYVTAKGRSEVEALQNALDKAEETIKPLTPAQRADIEAGRIIDPNAMAHIKSLNQQIAELSDKLEKVSKKKGKATDDTDPPEKHNVT